MNQPDQYWRELGLWPLWLDAPVSGQPPVDTLAGVPGSVRASQTSQASLPTAGSPAAAQGPTERAGVVLNTWEDLQQQVRQCHRCPLHQQRQQTVFGSGDRHPVWLFVGEGPGAEEDRQGLPFVGESGQLLDQMLQALGLKRSHQVYIANVVKCRPPHNRTPTTEECQHCLPYLVHQIRLLQPQIIVALGRVAAHSLLGSEQPLSRLRTETYTFEGIPLRVSWHPAYLLRNPADKAKAWEDLCQAQRLLRSRQSSYST